MPFELVCAVAIDDSAAVSSFVIALVNVAYSVRVVFS